MALKVKNNTIIALMVSCTVSACVLCATLVYDIIPKGAERIPRENFVSITITKEISTDSCLISEDCPEGASFEISQASGMSFLSKSGYTYILTANHFCEEFDRGPNLFEWEESYLEIKSTIQISDYWGYEWEGEIVGQDHEYDLCLIRSPEMNRVKPIKFARSMPHQGGRIYTISSPLSIISPGAVPQFEGIFSGCDFSENCFFSVPATFGSSGSLILDEDFKIIGMIQSASPALQPLSMGCNIYPIKNFLRQSGEELGTLLLVP
jgi:S1-C subfamily serine protease